LPDYQLTTHNNRLQLAIADLPPIYVDFLNGPLAYRQSHSGKKQPLARAVGIKDNRRPTIIDGTAGLGRDAFLLASLGCEVTCLERSAIVAQLLQDGISRALMDPKWQDKLQLTCHQCTLQEYLPQLTAAEYPDVIYLDPMFPNHNGNALVKKDMQALQQLLGPDENNSDLLAMAIDYAKQRVVVKRHRKSPYFDGIKPNYSLTGKTTRLDIYLRKQHD